MNNQLDIVIPKSYLIYESNKARQHYAVMPFHFLLFYIIMGEDKSVR